MRNLVKTTLVMDIECYVDYFLVMLRRVDTGATRHYEMFGGQRLDVEEIGRIMRTYRIVTFNGNNYDLPMLAYALTGKNCAELKEASDTIIVGKMKGWQFEQHCGVRVPYAWDHIDLIEVAFGQGSLKLYGGRLHSQKLQDLPIEPSARISPEQRAELVAYCGNDLQTTIDLFLHLGPQIELRERMSSEYADDLRSKSDAQIAEAVIRKQASTIIGSPVQKPTLQAKDKTFKFQVPKWLAYKSLQLRALLEEVEAATFFVLPDGSVEMPPVLDGRSVALGGSVYRMGIGGLHSSEQSQAYIGDAEYALIDRDVTSYYPAIILEGNLSPIHLKEKDAFIRVFRSIVVRRVEAKKAGDSVVANALKIVANGSFGKLGSRYSVLYSPHLMIQVTLTGQLALLMLIEALEDAGIRVISGNTDGIVMHCRRDQEDALQQVLDCWEGLTSFETEETRYAALFSRDVNNYLAIKDRAYYAKKLGEDSPEFKKMEKDGWVKGKGSFAKTSIAKNPQNNICTEAVIALIDKGVPIEQTICECQDIRKFVTVRTVRGGGLQILRTNYDETLTPAKKRDVLLADEWFAVVDGPLTRARFDFIPGGTGYDVETAYRMYCGEDETRYLGKVVRFYIGHSSVGAIYYREKNKTGGRNKVPKSDGAVPVMELPETLPGDIDYGHYIREANEILNDIGASEQKRAKLTFGECADLF
jgi:hypothetical protein